MLQALKAREGYVRIVCKRKDMQDFDLKITKYDIPEELSTAYKEYKQILNRSVYFFDINDYNTPEALITAANNKENLKSTILKKGERFERPRPISCAILVALMVYTVMLFSAK